MEKYTNALIQESSPYLLQHAHNPVNWVSWSDEVFTKAKLQNKMVLVSVGYSACHWCHVMEHECFEDEEVAALMNTFFICIKVDREERPDVDQVYMSAVQLMTQKGGWPLNCFTLADGRPIYGGTYFPKEQWMHILKSLQHTFENDREKVEEYAEHLHQGVQNSELITDAKKREQFSEEKLHEMVLRWSRNFDSEWLEKASQLTEITLKEFHDEKSKMFFFTSNSTQLIARKMELNDNVLPASNSVMAHNLFRLSHLYYNNEFKLIAEQMLANIYDGMEMYGSGYSNWGSLLLNIVNNYYHVSIMGNESQALNLNLQKNYLPNVLCAGGNDLKLPVLADKKIENETIIYVCYDGTCLSPVKNIEEVIRLVIQ